jgi:hypothetical protein
MLRTNSAILSFFRTWWRLILVAVGSLVVVAVISTYPCFDASTKANIWVAIGTLVLAGTTVSSLHQTRLIVAADERRHQQSFAPMLVLENVRNEEERVAADISNRGLGLAKKVLVLFERGSEFRSAGASIAGPRGPTQMPSVLPIPDSSGNAFHHISVIAKDGRTGLRVPQPPGWMLFVGRVRIEYSDMFGNEYVTLYRAYTDDINDMIWEQPQQLLIPRGSPGAKR